MYLIFDKQVCYYVALEDTARYAGLLLAPAEGFGLWAKKEPNLLFWPIFGNFWCIVVTLVTFSSNLSNFGRNPKKPKKIQKKCYALSFLILRGHNSTRALQSTPFQNPGGVV